MFRGPLEYGRDQLLWQNFVALPFAVVRRGRALASRSSFDPDLPTGEDWDLWLRCSQDGLVRTVPHVGYLYTQHGGTRVTRTAGGPDHRTAQLPGQARRRRCPARAGSSTRRCSPATRTGAAPWCAASVPGRGRSGSATRAVVAFLLASSFAAVRAGASGGGDPGLQARLMASLLARGSDVDFGLATGRRPGSADRGERGDDAWQWGGSGGRRARARRPRCRAGGALGDAARGGRAARPAHLRGLPVEPRARAFCGRLYRRITRSEGSFLLVAEAEGTAVGFIAGSVAVGRLYRTSCCATAWPRRSAPRCASSRRCPACSRPCATDAVPATTGRAAGRAAGGGRRPALAGPARGPATGRGVPRRARAPGRDLGARGGGGRQRRRHRHVPPGRLRPGAHLRDAPGRRRRC